jgi:hypothetical protein
VLKGGHPPIVIPRERRGDYLDVLWEYQNAVGRIGREAPLVPPHPALERFGELLRAEWQHTRAPVIAARQREAERQKGGRGTTDGAVL